MKYFVFTFLGLGLPVALRLQQEGCEVTVGQIEDIAKIAPVDEQPEKETAEHKRRRLSLYEGMIKKVPAEKLVEHILKETDPSQCFVFFDDNCQFRYADKLRGRGFHGNFPTAEDHRLEMSRAAAKEFVDKHYAKLMVAEKKEFRKASDGIAFLKDNEEFWVLKSQGESGRTIVPEVPDPAMANAQLIEALQKDAAEYENGGYVLELRINPVIELTPQIIFYNGERVCTNVDIENKPLGSGNISVQTGCAADLVFATELSDKINEIAFPGIVDEMARNHEGLFVWDASLLIDARSGKIYFGEYCSNRFGYNALFSEIALSGGSASRYFEHIVAGKSPYRQGQVAASVRLFNLQRDNGNYQAGLRLAYPENAEPNLWLWDVKKSKDGYVSTGFDRNVLVATATGPSVAEAVNKVYKMVEAVAFEGVYYRPKFDYISRDYPTSILNRLDYGLRRNLYKVGFPV
jgi:phosphoribosylamine-glycine ligase